MADTVRQLIAENIMTRLGAISITNGYSTDYGLVAEWKLTALEESDYPALVFLDDSNTVVDNIPSVISNIVHCRICIYARGTETPSQLRNMIQDVYKCLGADIWCGGYADDLKILDDNFAMAQKDNVYGSIDIRFDVYYDCRAYDLTTVN
jgi:hypothetical protein